MAHKTKIWEFLKEHGSSQREAAAAIGMNRTSFSLKASGFSSRDRKRLAEHYNVPIEVIEGLFIGEIEEENPLVTTDKTKMGRFLKSRGSTQNEAARIVGISKTAMSFKVRGYSDFKAEEIKKLADYYDMTNEEIASIFFEREG